MTTFKKYAFAALLAGAFAVPAALPAHAESKKASAESFKALDADKSGALSESEYSKDATSSLSFNEVDTNGDGTVTMTEFQTSSASPTSTEDAPSGRMQ